MQINPFVMNVDSSWIIAPGVKHFVLRAQGAPMQYIPGQFITIHFEANGKVYKRSYSIANSGDTEGRVEFAASFIDKGPGSEYLFSLKPGDEIQVSGPFGRLILKETPKRYVMVGTGTGITPYRAMLPKLHEKLMVDSNLRLVVLQGVRTQEEMIYAADFRAFAKDHPHVMFRACLSREQKENLEGDEWRGHVQTHFHALDLDPSQDLVYLCGNPKMIDEAYAWLTEHGFTVHQVVREKYISR
jgi:ferredoxin-NADP reductase